MKKIISIIAILTMVLGLSSVALADKENEITIEEKAVIAADDIGIKTIAIGDDFENEEFIEDESTKEDMDDEVTTEDEDLYDDVEVEEEIPEADEPEVNEPETESPAPPEGKVEGYVAGVYFDPNTVDCEICGGECYTCHNNEHVYAHCVSVDERGYIYEEWCTVCGHGTEKPISDEEFEALGVETCVEF